MKKYIVVLLFLCVFSFFAVYLHHFQFLTKLFYDQYQMDDDLTGVIRTPARKYEFHDDLLTPGAGFNTTEILLYSAVARNTTEMSHWDTVSVFGWESEHMSEQVYKCCFLYPSRRTDLRFAKRIKFRKSHPCPAIARHFTCKLKNGNRKERAVAVTLTSIDNPFACTAASSSYVDIHYPYKHQNDIAVFAKVVFGDLYARDIITWFEVHRLFGFSKVFMYPYLLNTKATRVLQYYERLGLLEIIPYTIPGPEHGYEYTPLGTKTFQGWNHKDVAIMDGLERLRGYKYLVSFDVDEYIIPKRNESWMDLFDRLFRQKEDAATFYFGTYIYIKNWGATYKNSTFSIGRYLTRTRLTSNTRKHVSMPRRIMDGGFTSHIIYPLRKYETYTVNKEDAAVYHFRSCRERWLTENSNFPCYRVNRFYDDTVKSYFKKVEKDVLHVVSKLKV